MNISFSLEERSYAWGLQACYKLFRLEVWSIVACCISANDLPNSMDQYRSWFQKWIPRNIQMHSFVLVGICWAIWKARNKACFENKVIKLCTVLDDATLS